MTDTLDTKAADQFQPVHRSGHGAITFEGREYTRLAWIERTARNGGTLAEGEGAVLCAEIDRLRAKVGRVWKVTRKQSMSAAESCDWGDPYTTRVVGVVSVRAALKDNDPAPTGTLCDDPCEDLPNCHCGERT